MIKRRIALVLALSIIAAPVAQVKALGVKTNAPIVTKQNIKEKSKGKVKEKSNRFGIEGSITKLVKEKNKASVLITGESLSEQGYNEVKLLINSGTRIVDENNKSISYNDLEEGMEIKAYFPKTVSKSNPPQAVAKEIIVTSEKTNEIQQSAAEGDIVDINEIKEGIMINVQKEETANPIEGQIRFSINDKTEIVNEKNGKKLTIDDIQEGMKVKVYYAPFLTASISPIGYAEKVVILKEQQKEIKEVKGEVMDTLNYRDGLISYVESEGTSFFAFISKYTEITDVNGKELSFDDIKKGKNIKVIFNERNDNVVLKRYIPNICAAQKVIVLQENQQETMRIEGTIKGISDIKDGASMLIDGKRIDKNGFNKVKLNVSEDTKIIDGEDGSKLEVEDLEEGMKVRAYYGATMTRSLPPIGTAEKIIVIDDDEEDDDEYEEYTLIGKYMEKRENGYIDVLCGDIVHRINIEEVQEDLKNIEKGSLVEIEYVREGSVMVAHEIEIED